MANAREEDEGVELADLVRFFPAPGSCTPYCSNSGWAMPAFLV